ncbi:membrane protein [Corynebacterium sphenisci DSM 44792]|uniref:Membrane protein n=1 Tax=Corynebacterium sphenisci DSM 44792 TaxID=1437874 RepID=A0A1L7CVJ4_9CORY|nr:phage holin family protein [Corynebacterium sphenisci]APT89872.1 membrane protein [Corynebacterium sphenisci DSM 44792]
MSSDENKGLFTDGDSELSPRVSAIPLSDVDTHARGTAGIGTLVQDASQQISSLVRSEMELAKAELAQEAKKGAMGGGFFAVAGVIALYSTFFLFLFLSALIAEWLPLWAGFLITFVLMLVIAGVFALLGLKKVKKVGAPKKTIASVQDLKQVIPGKDGSAKGVAHRDDEPGLYT